MVLKFHRDALDGCAAAAKSAAGAFEEALPKVPDRAQYGVLNAPPGTDSLLGAGALCDAVAEVARVAADVAGLMAVRLKDVDLALDAVERTVTAADTNAVQR